MPEPFQEQEEPFQEQDELLQVKEHPNGKTYVILLD
jgi:hypothetical protein